MIYVEADKRGTSVIITGSGPDGFGLVFLPDEWEEFLRRAKAGELEMERLVEEKNR